MSEYFIQVGKNFGTNYTSPNKQTDPLLLIFKIETIPFKYDDIVVPVGTFTFTKI